MARQLRIEYEGAFYHVTARGNERRWIVRDDEDRGAWQAILAESLDVHGVTLHAFCLMDNHYHLLVETPRGNLAAFVRRLNQVYALAFNRRYRRVGHLFQGRYKAFVVEREAYVAAVSRYIHLNPYHTRNSARLEPVARLADLCSYPWSSLPGYRDPGSRLPFVRYATVLEAYGDDVKGRDGYWGDLLGDLEERRDVEVEAIGGVVLGDNRFVRRLSNRMAGIERRELPALRRLEVEANRDRVIRAVCAATGLVWDDLRTVPGWRRWLLMDALVRHAGLLNSEVAELLDLGESTISLGRRHLKSRRQDSDSIAEAFGQLARELERK